MKIAFTGGSDNQRHLVTQAVNAVNDRYLNLEDMKHTWSVVFLPPNVIDTTPHDSFKTFMVTQNDGTTQIRNDMPFKGQGPYAGVKFFQESVVHELGHHLLGNGPGMGHIGNEQQKKIAAMFDSTPSTWNPQNKPWENRAVEGIAETFKDSFLAADRREYFNRTKRKLAIVRYPAFRKQFRNVDFPRGFESPRTGHDIWRLDPGQAGFDVEFNFDEDPGQWASNGGANMGPFDAGTVFSWSLPSPPNNDINHFILVEATFDASPLGAGDSVSVDANFSFGASAPFGPGPSGIVQGRFIYENDPANPPFSKFWEDKPYATAFLGANFGVTFTLPFDTDNVGGGILVIGGLNVDGDVLTMLHGHSFSVVPDGTAQALGGNSGVLPYRPGPAAS